MTHPVKQSLAGEWQFREAGSVEWLPASVPGGVHTDLLRAGRIEDPFVGDEEKRVQWVAQQDWEYRRTIFIDEHLLSHDRVQLVCDGLDTLATVILNGRHIGVAENMFRPYRWDVRDALRAGENEILVAFASPVAYAAARNNIRPMPDVNNPIPGAPYLREAPSHFGWDWGPHLPPIGIWRDIRLEAYSIARLADVAVRQHHSGGKVTLSVSVLAEIYGEAPLRVSLRLTSPSGQTQTTSTLVHLDRAEISLPVTSPQLWWPNGYGEQPLYIVEITLDSGGALADTAVYTLGLRTLELRQLPDEWGTSFTFVVNGLPVFAKGSNWIPADSFPTRVSHAQLDHLLGSAADANHNMVRVWGGGYYEDEYLYDLCDRYGLLVWQDFMFACAGYPLDDPSFVENVRAEVVANVRRLRHRACLALWCGNNEIESAWVDWGWNTPENADLMRAYERFFYTTLAQWVAAEDPDHAYWPSSPSSNTPMRDPNGNAAGDIHQWAVWHANKPFSNYRETPARFVSEFGFESLPPLLTIASFAAPSDWNITSYNMEHHQRSPVGNEKIVLYMLENFRLPKDFANLVYLSQLLQAEAMRVGVEFWRRHPACSGALYWQLNDCWPVISWSGIDYFGRWKALHYSSRRFFAPLLLSIEDQGTSMIVFVTNERREPWEGTVHWSLETLAGEPIDSGDLPLVADPLTTTSVRNFDFASLITDENRRNLLLVCDLVQGNRTLQRTVATFAPTKHLALIDPQLKTEVAWNGTQLSIKLSAMSLARFVELSLDGADVLFSDNYFDLPAGRSAQITCPLPPGWTLVHAQQALRVRSVFDSY
ncbi:MAG: glycoside hydrolase family 2 protein [Chloroflexota bacterium]